jgi:hypothetical protein
LQALWSAFTVMVKLGIWKSARGDYNLGIKKMKIVKLALSVLAVLAIGATAASAAPLIGTGNPTTGVPGDPEANWTVLPLLKGSDGLYVVSGAADYPGAWIDPTTNGLTAKWISPYATAVTHTEAINDPNANSKFQDYTYTLSGFSSPGSDAIIKWASDNGASFFLNGSAVLSTIASSGFGSLTTFSILATDANWLATGNKFVVVVENEGFDGANPTGLLVDISTVPLPPALLLFGSALVGMNWLRRRRTGQKLGSPMMVART